MTKRSSKTSTRKSAVPAQGAQIRAWENDPFAQAVPTNPPSIATPILRPIPKLSATDPLPIRINEPMPAPAGQFNPGTVEFRYWTAAEALRRGADFWNKITKVKKWFKTIKKELPVMLDAGVDFNAFYDRSGLEFFHGSAGGSTFFSGESPDIVCHELGHAVLDAIRPQLFNAGFVETAAFHESFGDMSAILSALQLPSMRQDVLAETHGTLSRDSSLSRLAEQLGFAIRISHPNSVERNCLRNASNSFFYRDPSTLPPSAPASALSSEPHSFSRVFTGAFLEILGGMLAVAAGTGVPTEAQLLAVSEVAAGYLIKAIATAAVVPAYYSQVATAMVQASAASDRNAVTAGFVHHGILSLSAAVAAQRKPAAMAEVSVRNRNDAEDLGKISMGGDEYGLNAKFLFVHATPEAGGVEVSGAAFAAGEVTPPASAQAAKDFFEDLLQLGRVESSDTSGVVTLFARSHARKTHRLEKERDSLRLIRVRFDCGFDCGCR